MSTFSVASEASALDAQPNLPPRTQQQIAAAVAKAQAECLNFCNLMYKKLPRELRDLVYNFLCLEDRQIPVGPYYHYRKYEPHRKDKTVEYSNTQYFPRNGDLQTDLSDGKTRIDHDVYPQDDLLLPHSHIFDARYVSVEIAVETLKTYYQSNCFSVCNIGGGLDSLCMAVERRGDATTDFVPIDHIHELQIRVKLEHMYTAPKEQFRTRELLLQEFLKQEPLLRSTIESLQKFRSRIQTVPSHELDLEIVLISEFQQESTSIRTRRMNLLQTIRNTIYELLHDRGNTTVRVTHQDESVSAFPKDYTGLFKLTKEQWEFEKAAQQPTQDSSHHFWIFPFRKKVSSDSENLDFGGYDLDDVLDFMSKRWGIADIIHDTTSFLAIVECPYWPVGRPYNPQAAQACLDAEQIIDGGSV